MAWSRGADGADGDGGGVGWEEDIVGKAENLAPSLRKLSVTLSEKEALMPQAAWPCEGPRPGCAGQSSGQEVPVQTMSWHHFNDSLPSADRNCVAGLYHLSASRKFRGSSVGTSLQGKLGGPARPAAWRGPFSLPWQGAPRKLSLVLPFPVRFGTRRRAWVFIGPVWRQVFQIKTLSPSLKDGCPLRAAAAPAPLLGDKYLNK